MKRTTLLLHFILLASITAFGQNGTVKSYLKISDFGYGTLGWSAEYLGDIDEDGDIEVIIGIPSLSGYGQLFISSLKENGLDTSDHVIIGRNKGGFGNDDIFQERFGNSVCNLGDVDGDGIPDIAVGVPGGSKNQIQVGAIYVLFLNSDGTVKDYLRITENENGFTENLNSEDEFGTAVCTIRDLDGDGINELAVSAPRRDDGNPGSGAVYILFLNEEGKVSKYKKIGNQNSLLNGEIRGIGTDITSIGDFNGDDIPDLVVGAELDYDGGTAKGAVWIFYLNKDGGLKDVDKISDLSGDFSGVLPEGGLFGTSVTNLGDLDGDGIIDLAVGATNTNKSGIEGNYEGAVYILFLNKDATVKDHLRITTNENGFNDSLIKADLFGLSVEKIPDLDGDNVPELLVGMLGGTADRDGFYLLFLNGQPQVSIKEPSISNPLFKIYPNPASEEIYLQAQNQKLNNQSLKIKAYDQLGQLVLKDQVFPSFNDTYHLNTTALKTGIYHLVIETKDQVIKEKVLISK